MPGHPMAANMPYAPPIVRPAMRDRIPRLAYRLFTALFIFSLLNVGAIVTYLFGQPWIPINPVVFAIAIVPILLMTPSRPQSVYFWIAWTFWLVYAVGGFLGPHQATGDSNYTVAQVVFKLWISMIGIPWLALRCVSEQRLPQLVKTAYMVMTFGAVFAILQALLPSLSPQLMSDQGRGSGFWIDPNNCGALCGIAVFLSVMYPLRSPVLNFTFRALLIGGLVVSLSRAGILGFVISAIIYGLAMGRFAALAKSVATVLILSLVGVLSLQFLDTSDNPVLKDRVRLVKQFLQGDISSAEQQSSRLKIWGMAMDAISKDWFLGRGHGSMSYVVDLRGGLGPHNYYLYVWGNSGLLALLALLLYFTMLLRTALKCRERKIRAGMVSLVFMLTILTMFVHHLFEHQFLGAILSMFALIGVYGRRKGRPLFQYPAKGMPPLAHPQLPSS